MDKVFEAVREACSPQLWSRGIELVRADAVVGERDDGDALVVRVVTKGGMIARSVTLFLADGDWECTCGAAVCEHAAAGVIATRRAREEGRELPRPRSATGVIAYRFTRAPGGLALRRGILLDGAFHRFRNHERRERVDLHRGFRFHGPRADGEDHIAIEQRAVRRDPAGDRVVLPAARRDDVAGLFVEHGVADRFAVLFKGDWQRGKDAFVDYDGHGPLEIGVRWQAWRDDRGAASLQISYADGGEGRNAGYAPPGQGDTDWEIRGAVGRNFSVEGRPVFVDLQAARRMRDGLPEEVRADATVGVYRELAA